MDVFCKRFECEQVGNTVFIYLRLAFSLKGDIFTQIFMPHYYVSKSRYLNYPPL